MCLPKNLILLIGICLLAGPIAYSQPAEKVISKQEYIEMYKDDAIREMHLSGVPASITLAQGMLESNFGNSALAKYANNHFGIKCHKDWDGPTFHKDDDLADECFRKYYTAYESFRDHSEFLRGRRWYDPLFELKVTDYKGWARGLKKAGYATNPRYADILIKLIEENELYEYDKAKKMPALAEKSQPKGSKRKKQQRKPVATSKVKITNVVENDIRYTIAGKGDTVEKLSKKYQMRPWQFYKYNEIEKGTEFSQGDVVYLQPKRKKARKEYHVVKDGETMWEISQRYGIRLQALYDKNNMEPGDQPRAGQQLFLRQQKPS